MNTETPEILSQRIFGLLFPLGEKDLRSKYRQMCLKGEYRHPDAGGTEKDFIVMQKAYEFLIPYCSLNITLISNKTVNGIELSSLGKGLGTTVNGVSCEVCEGQGYYSIKIPQGGVLTPCMSCRYSTGFHVFKGVFHICRACGGTGKRRINQTFDTIFHICRTCEGVGEVRLFNPVFQRGGIR